MTFPMFSCIFVFKKVIKKLGESRGFFFNENVFIEKKKRCEKIKVAMKKNKRGNFVISIYLLKLKHTFNKN